MSGIKLIDGISDYLEGLATRANLTPGFLNRVAYPMVLKAQRVRWQTENASEGDKWEPLNPSYRRSKLKRFRDYPGSGSKMMVATGQLYKAVTGEDRNYHRKLVKGARLEISIEQDPPRKQLAAMVAMGGEKAKKKLEQMMEKKDESRPVFDYAGFANDARNFTEFGEDTIEEIAKAYMYYLMGK